MHARMLTHARTHANAHIHTAKKKAYAHANAHAIACRQAHMRTFRELQKSLSIHSMGRKQPAAAGYVFSFEPILYVAVFVDMSCVFVSGKHMSVWSR